jgi:hypothetical protein
VSECLCGLFGEPFRFHSYDHRCTQNVSLGEGAVADSDAACNLCLIIKTVV